MLHLEMGLHEAVGDPIQDKAKLKGILTTYFPSSPVVKNLPARTFDDIYQSKILYDPPPRLLKIFLKSKQVGPD